VAPRSNAVIKSKKRVISFAGKSERSTPARDHRSRPEVTDDTDVDDNDVVDDDDDGGDSGTESNDGDSGEGGADSDSTAGEEVTYKPPPRRAKPPPTDTDLFTVQEAAGYLNCSPQTLDKMRRTGKPQGPAYVMIGDDLIRYHRAELERYIASRQFTNTAQT
jgi:hypothetical protein